MPLDRNKLATDLKAVMDRGKKDNLTPDQVAEALADAIHTYTAAAEVAGVQGSVQDQPFTQSGKGKLQ
ncbi:MAG TPA: hypothetical protein VGJ86_10495 [Acidimicrobiales bacterium]